MRYEPVQIHIAKGDILTSQLGILTKSSMSDRFFTTKKIKYLGNGHFEILGDKEEMDVKELKP